MGSSRTYGLAWAITISAPSWAVPPATAPVVAEPPPHASWIDSSNGDEIFTSRDILRFDWQRQVFELTREAAMDLMSEPHTLRRDFLVRDPQGEIYRGCFMSNRSSMSYDGPTIVPDHPEVHPPLYRIDGGYPGPRAGRPDQRLDARLKQALTAAGILREIRNSADVARIETNFSGWHGDALGSRLAVTVFRETIRQGRDIRLVLRFAHDTKADEARTRQRTEDRRPLTTSRHGRLALKVHMTLRGTGQVETTEWVKTDFCGSCWQTAVPCRVRPWGSGANSADIRTGPAEMAIRVEAYRHRTHADPIGSWSVPAQTVRVLPAEGRASRSGGDRF